jgi:hypothetical protein
MIKKQSEKIQFINVTFKKELLDVADKYFMISFKNKVSKLNETNKENAISILDEEEKALPIKTDNSFNTEASQEVEEEIEKEDNNDKIEEEIIEDKIDE